MAFIQIAQFRLRKEERAAALRTCTSREMRCPWTIAGCDSQRRHKVSRREVIQLALGSILLPLVIHPQDTNAKTISSAYDIVAQKDGKAFKLNKFSGKVTLFVNVATYCGLTRQYTGLVSLHNKFQPQGFEIIASPCNQFAAQEPRSNEEICQFAKEKFGAQFLLLDKLNVNGNPDGVAPLYRFLRDTSPEDTGKPVGWNFEKFLVGGDGKVLRRYKAGVIPDLIEGDVQWALEHPGRALPKKEKVRLGAV